MTGLPDHIRNFADFKVQEAVYRTPQKEEVILLESRISAMEDELWFTVVDNKVFRANSIHELVNTLPALVSLSLPHSIRLLWNDLIKKAELVEIFRPHQSPTHPSTASLQLTLTIDNKTYETPICDTLMDGIWELQEITGPEVEWWLYACYHCQYSGHARDYLVEDREYWCYRDVPEAFEEIRSKGKQASPSARYAGKYLVNAFHTCAGWRLKAPPEDPKRVNKSS